ncbi:hypothetical protein PVAND_011652 [Polypedilum vanderplanki]|uniref:CLIP domain-containing serine protease n=1 Tax=Polypedilum vanderplanki TaxID=319348 RepID=A0A9J6CJX5_POLVA|nr:hypothetical protein PVAND_011652 [Polypedilum vanderplanki]
MLSQIARIYQNGVSKYPYLAQGIQTAALISTGDIIAQKVVQKKASIDYKRYCNFIVNLIVQYQQKADDAILNYLKKSVCGQEGNDPMVCCPALVFASLTGTSTSPSTIPPAPFVFSSISTSSSSTIVNNSPSQSTSNGGLTFGPINTGGTSVTTTKSTLPSTTFSIPVVNQLPTNDINKCGMVYSLNSRIVGGQSATPNSYPWLAALGYNITNSTTKISTTQFLCGSTLITQRHLVSAAHCIISTLLLARLGAYDITKPPDGINTIDAYVISAYVHELYDPKTISNDISIIKLDRILPVTNSIRPVCIPLNDALRTKNYTGLMAWVAGWGSTSFGGPASATLQEVQLPIVATADCSFNYKLYFPNQVFDDNILCAGFSQGGKDSCQGDSGGGLVIQQLSADGTYYYYNIIGIVSYGYECARPGFPGIYTRITQYITWIQSKIIL